MNYTKVKCLNCEDVIMGGNGASIGGRIEVVNLKCHECGLTIMIVPTKPQYRYAITATTEEERKAERIQKARDESELELAKTITRINETGF